jgi:hypothetical protein
MNFLYITKKSKQILASFQGPVSKLNPVLNVQSDVKPGLLVGNA